MSDHEYGAMVWCWERVGQRQGLAVRTFPLPTMASDPGEIVEAAVKAITPRTRLLFFSHVLSPTGLVLPAKELCAEARSRGVMTVVDGAHAPAMIPLNVERHRRGLLHRQPAQVAARAERSRASWSLVPGNEDRLQPLHVSWGYHPDKYPIGEIAQSDGAGRARQLRLHAAHPLPRV